jgi:hypothetical protein
VIAGRSVAEVGAVAIAHGQLTNGRGAVDLKERKQTCFKCGLIGEKTMETLVLIKIS